MAKHNINTFYSPQLQFVTTAITRAAFYLENATRGIAKTFRVSLLNEKVASYRNALHCWEWPARVLSSSRTSSQTSTESRQNARLHLADVNAGCQSDEMRREQVNRWTQP